MDFKRINRNYFLKYYYAILILKLLLTSSSTDQIDPCNPLTSTHFKILILMHGTALLSPFLGLGNAWQGDGTSCWCFSEQGESRVGDGMCWAPRANPEGWHHPSAMRSSANSLQDRNNTYPVWGKTVCVLKYPHGKIICAIF